jgi:hypothetical protein
MSLTSAIRSLANAAAARSLLDYFLGDDIDASAHAYTPLVNRSSPFDLSASQGRSQDIELTTASQRVCEPFYNPPALS